MQILFQDLRFALRNIRKNPVFALLVILSIGFGVGANTTVFAWVESLLLNPYHPQVASPNQLVGLNSAPLEGEASGYPPVSYLTYKDWRERSKSFDGMVVYNATRFNVRSETEELGTSVWGQFVSGNYFDVLHLRPALGQTFTSDDENKANAVAVISHHLWKNKFAGNSAIIGQHIKVNGADVTVIGVAPQNFYGMSVGLGFDVWLPVTLQPVINTQAGNQLKQRGDRWLQVFARLREGVTIEQARAEMTLLARQISEASGEYPATTASVKFMREQFAGEILSPLFSSLMIVTGLILLIACANVANLLLARSTARQKEIGIRLALGASRWQIVRQLMTESILLSLLGGVVGFLLALWAGDLLSTFIPPIPQPILIAVSVNSRVIGFAFLISLCTAVGFGLLPALRASKPELVPLLKDETRSFGVTKSRLRNALVVSQVAFSLVSLICAGLFLRSLQASRSMQLGFADPDHVLLITTDLNLAGLNEATAINTVERLLERARTLPGVTEASFSTMVPLGFGGHSFSGTTVDGYTPAPNEDISIERVIITPGYFATMGIPILQGRAINEQDTQSSMRVTVINEAFAHRYWQGENPIGKRLNQGKGWATVVGVVKNSTYCDLGEVTPPVIYSALPQWYTSNITLHLRTAEEPKRLTEAMRREFINVNANLPFLDPRTLTDNISAATVVQYIGASMLSLFGSLSLVLATIGLYGVLSFVVAQRRRELAIRMALGATAQGVMRLVFLQGLRLITIGLAIGIAFALILGQLLRSQLLNISPSDPLTFIIISFLLAGVALGACVLPARRAARTDPMVALRYE